MVPSGPMVGKPSAARLRAGKMVLSVLNKVMEFMGSYGYSFEYLIESIIEMSKSCSRDWAARKEIH